ncbi:MAG: PilZ domain-containing protein [Bacteriovoracaceae bacterium]|nr:PilZ domain-containing protein [Bacteriovoracaceae bacterium]
MKQKPFFITLISYLCFIEPLIKIFYFKATTHFDLSVIISNIGARDSFADFFEFWLLYPLAGMMLVRLRNWTYISFITLMSYTIYSILNYEEYTWPYNSSEPFIYNVVLAACSFGVIVFFFLPGTRKPFFDARVRWWEPMVRYNVEIPCELSTPTGKVGSTILNISKSGVFIEDKNALVVGDIIRMDMVAHGEALSVMLVVKNKHIIKGQHGFGAQFYFESLNQYVKVRQIISHVKKAKKEAPNVWAKAA